MADRVIAIEDGRLVRDERRRPAPSAHLGGAARAASEEVR